VTHNLVLSGGPGHALDVTSASLVALLAEQGIRSTVVTEPTDAVAALRRAAEGTGEAVDLLTVNALRWRMDQDRYAGQRADHARTLDPDDLAVIDRFVRKGGGLLALHTAVICFDADPVWHALCGASWRWDRSSHPPLGPAGIDVTGAGRVHPITRGVEPFVIHDEVYGFLDEVRGLEPLLVSAHGGRSHPLLWARPVGAGRIVTDLLGHGPESHEHPTHRLVLARAAAWAVGSPPADTDGSAPAGPAAATPTTTATTTTATTATPTATPTTTSHA
jgi:type 1 glutamine amidotransferase